MTPSELRDLDASVQKLVFEIHPRPVRAKGSTNDVVVWTDAPTLIDGLWTAHELLVFGACPKHSADMASAWPVVQKMYDQDFNFEIVGDTYGVHAQFVGKDGRKFRVIFSVEECGEPPDLNKLAEAICLAACKAKSARPPEGSVP